VAGAGGEVIGINPLGEMLPVAPRQASPYSPSSRHHLDPIYVDPDAVPGAAPSKPGRRPGLDADGLIDRDVVWTAKRGALLQQFRWAGSPEVGGTRDDEDHARFCALVEHYGSGWPDWPEELRHPREEAVERWALDHLDEVAFWRWLSKETDRQFDAATASLRQDGLALIGDLTVGVDPWGYDAWVHQDVLASGMSIGAPPDTFNTAGQNWGLPPFEPWALRAAAYRPFTDMLRAMFRRFGGLRIDHVMGLFRLFWIPPGADPSQGAYVRYRVDELLALIVMEGTRAGAFVVGEDLGTVEEGVRETLADHGISGTRVGWFDGDLPGWPWQSLGTLTTHDLPTVVGAVSGRDDTADPAMAAQLLESLDVSTAEAEADPTAVLLDAHAALGASGSALVLATMEDVVGSPHRVNLPGPDQGYPSWRRPLGVPIDELDTHPVASRVVRAVADGRRSPGDLAQG
jgi:4-alpha-glucanotransferase